MSTANDIITLAKKQLGIKESPAGSNKVKYNTWYYGKAVSGSAYPWCMTFVQWVFNEAGSPLELKTASCTQLMKYAKKNGKWVTRGYQPGDIILFQFDKDSDAEHTGICESVAGSNITCIEGNTSINGSQSNGGEVCRRTRSMSLVLGAYRPDFNQTKSTAKGKCTVELRTLSKGCKGDDVRALQILLMGNNYSCGRCGADGDFGTGTLTAVKKFQKAKKLTTDGVVGKNTWAALLT